MEYKTIAGNYYTITSKSGCSVTDATGTLSMTVDAGGQLTVQAPSDKLVYDDEQAIVFKANFKSALAALGLLGGGADKLPAGYTRAEFLESTGTQLITVSRSLTVAADCRFTFKAQNTGGTGWQHAFGARVTANTKEFGVAYNTSGGTAQVSLGGATVSIPCNLSEVHEIKADGATGTVVCGSETRSITLGQISMSSVGVFHRSGVSTHLTGRIFKASIFNNGQQFFQLVPALDPSGTPCMFDIVSKTAFKNSGSGQFIAGMTLSQVRGLRLPAGGGKLTLSLPHEASIDRLAQAALERALANGWELTLQYAEAEVPAGYRKLDFLESTGTQWIDSGVKLSSESEVTCEFSVQDISKNGKLYGADYNGGVPIFRVYAPVSENIVFYCGGTTTSAFGTHKMKSNARYSVVHNNDFCVVNGVKTTSVFAETNWETLYTAALFGCKTSQQPIQVHNGARFYTFSISRAGEQQVDYVPCIAPDGALGMYNRVDGTVQENAGSGQFIAGLATVEDVRKLWLPETGGPLTVSVPSDTPDSAVEQLRKNNPTWQIAIQYRTDNEN